ncbi:GerAB/ArcD/ProY family transporter [Neobacillus cucumis]|uniref:GerAB/ArcD/ProY family transporter n=1 Tax=Neobacillus cucumis TaxID=1740721 RepID=UPI0018E05F49|nr:GerAB/ArcD/ProY family transporter [Neobacillus cucumis]MBI0579595.1 GerAB/ArcD/ProY family transporter [Neobacillus cucumis]
MNIKINGYQLFVLIVLFEMGSAILFAPGSQAKQDAWISVLLGLAGGLLLFHVYYRLYLYYPDMPLTGYIRKITGKWVGTIIGLFYPIYFLYLSARILRDFGELLVTTTYTSTPLFIVNSLMVLTIVYASYKGFEVIARMAELHFYFIYLFAFMGFLMILFSGLIHIGNLQPILENGLTPVLKMFITQTIYFPFGEMVVFTMFLPYINNKKTVKAICLGGMILAGINIVITSVVNISVLGVELFTRSNFPLFSTVGKIQISSFIQRLDPFFLIYLIIAGFFKITLFFYAALIGIVDIFKFDNHRKIIFPAGLIILFLSIQIASNYSEHMLEGEVITYYLHIPFQIIIPFILLILAYFRNRRHKKVKEFKKE